MGNENRLLRATALAVGFSVVASAALSITEHEVTFENAGVALSGTLTLPDGPGPHPAVVFLHGSGSVTREGAQPYARRFADIGLAGLRFDKRGSGESTGSWVASSLDDLALDAVAAIHFLKARPEIDASRIGFWGVSQAGWVATQATAYSDDISFMVVISGGGVSPYESELFSYRTALEGAGFEGDDLARALDTVETYMSYLGSGEGRDAAAAAIEAARNEPWHRHLRLERIFPSSDVGRQQWSWVANWDPAPLAERIRFPVLVMFGSRDDQAPPEASVEAWRQALEKAGNRNYRIEVYPEAGHAIRLWSQGHHPQVRLPQFAAGYHETMLEWLSENVIGRESD